MQAGPECPRPAWWVDTDEQHACVLAVFGLDSRDPRYAPAADASSRAVLAAEPTPTADPPPLDPNRPFVINQRYDDAMARVRATDPRPGSADAPAPALPPGEYQPGPAKLVRRIAAATPDDLAAIHLDIQALYLQPGAHRAGETLIRAAGDAAECGRDAKARQAILNDIAPIALRDPEQLASEEMGLAGMVLGAGVLATKTTKAMPEMAAVREPAGAEEVAATAPQPPEPIVLSRRQFGHAFETHGQGATRFLTERAKAMGRPNGQFLDDQAAARFIEENLAMTKNGAVSVPLPEGFPARMINPDGSFSPARSIRIVPRGQGIKTAFPEP